MNKYVFKNIRTSYFLPFLSSLLTVFALVFDTGAYLIFVSLIPLFIFLYYEKSLLHLWAGSFSFYFVANTIICLFSVMEPANLLLSGLIFSFLGVFIWLIKKYFFEPELFGLFLRFKFFKFIKNKHGLWGSSWTFWVLLPFLVVVLQYILITYSYIPTVSGALGNALAFTVFFPLAGVAGLWGLTFFAVVVNTIILRIIVDKKNRKKLIFIFFIFILLSLIFSYILMRQAERVEYKNDINAAVVSFSFENIVKSPEYKGLGDRLEDVEDEKMNIFLNKMLHELKDKIPDGADYVFLPTSIWGTIREDDTSKWALENYGISNNGSAIVFASRLARLLNKNVITGMVTREYGKKYNSSIFFDKNGNIVDIYHKTNLMISSEYWPFGDWVPFWVYWMRKVPSGTKIHIDPGFFRSETPFSVFETEDVNIGALICSETLFLGNFKKVRNNGADFVFTSVNNDWRVSLDHLGFFRRMNLKTLRINSFYYDIPIVLTGKENYAGTILPNGEYDVIDPPKEEKFRVWFGKVRY